MMGIFRIVASYSGFHFGLAYWFWFFVYCYRVSIMEMDEKREKIVWDCIDFGILPNPVS